MVEPHHMAPIPSPRETEPLFFFPSFFCFLNLRSRKKAFFIFIFGKLEVLLGKRVFISNLKGIHIHIHIPLFFWGGRGRLLGRGREGGRGFPTGLRHLCIYKFKNLLYNKRNLCGKIHLSLSFFSFFPSKSNCHYQRSKTTKLACSPLKGR